MLHLVIDKFADWIYRRAFRIVKQSSQIGEKWMDRLLCSLSVEAAQPER